MSDGRDRRGSKAAKSKPFAVECSWENKPWAVWRRYRTRADAEKAVKDLPKNFKLIGLQARIKDDPS